MNEYLATTLAIIIYITSLAVGTKLDCHLFHLFVAGEREPEGCGIGQIVVIDAAIGPNGHLHVDGVAARRINGIVALHLEIIIRLSRGEEG